MNTADDLAAAATLTWWATDFTHRDDLIVTVGFDDEHPGRYIFDEARIHIDLSRFDIDPSQTLCGSSWVHAHPEVLGVVVHEIGHADHTPRRRVPPSLRAWVDLLEEPRVERAMVDAYPETVGWLAASARRALVVREAHAPADAVAALILSLGRVHAGVLDDGDIVDLVAIVERALPPTIRAEVFDVIATAVHFKDQQLTDILAAAARIVALLEGVGADTDPAAVADHQATTRAEDGGGPNDSTSLGENASTDPPGGTMVAGGSAGIDNGVDNAHRMSVTAVAAVTSSSRAPSQEERIMVSRIGSWLRGNDTEAVVRRSRPRSRPTGHLRMQSLMRAQSQHDLGLSQTATPWIRTQTRHDQTASVELAVIIDRSKSMEPQLDRVAGTTWVIGQSLTPGLGRSCTWVFSEFAEVLPQNHSDRVTVPTASGGSTALAAALKDYQIWSTPGAAKVLAIISDGALRGDAVQPMLAAIAATGTRIIWFTPTSSTMRLPSFHAPAGTPIVALDDVDLAQELGSYLVLSASRAAPSLTASSSELSVTDS